MIHPTISDLTKDNYNRYQLAIATAKCARLITDEYVKQTTAVKDQRIGEIKAFALEKKLKDNGQDVQAFAKYYGVDSLADLTEEQHRVIYEGLRKRAGNGKDK